MNEKERDKSKGSKRKRDETMEQREKETLMLKSWERKRHEMLRENSWNPDREIEMKEKRES